MASAPSAPSVAGRAQRVSAADQDNANLKKAVSQPSLRRSKSRGEVKEEPPRVIQATAAPPFSSGHNRSKATSPAPPQGYQRQSDATNRIPKRTPRMSPRGSLPGPGAKAAANDLPPSNLGELHEEFRPAVVLPGSYRGLASFGTMGTTSGGHNSSVMMSSPLNPYERYDADIRHHPASASLSGTTTPTEGGDLPLLRLRAGGGDTKNAQAVERDSRIMKLIGRRSVLSGASLYTQPEAASVGPKGIRPLREQQHQGARKFQPLGRGNPSSPSSPPQTSGLSSARQHLGPSSAQASSKPLGEANRKLPRMPAYDPNAEEGDATENGFGYPEAKAKAENALMAALLSSSPSQDNLISASKLTPSMEAIRRIPSEEMSIAPDPAEVAAVSSAAAAIKDPVAPVRARRDSDGSDRQPVGAESGPPGQAANTTGVNTFGTDVGSDLVSQDPARNLLESFATGAPEGYPVEADEKVPTFGLTASDRAATLGQTGPGTIFPVPAEQALEVAQPAVSSDMTAGASQEDTTVSAVEGSQNAIIWPGRQATDQQEDIYAEPEASASACMQFGGGWPAAPQEQADQMQLGGAGAMWPQAMMQNEAGSLVVFQTWRYVPPPSQVTSPRTAGGDPLSPQMNINPDSPLSRQVSLDINAEPLSRQVSLDTNAEEMDNNISIVKPISEEDPHGAVIKPRQAEAEAFVRQVSQSSAESDTRKPRPARPLDYDAKRQLVGELVECLTARALKAEQALGAEQRTNRALNVTLEVTQRQNLLLQQQLQQFAYMAQNFQYGEELLQAAQDGGAAQGDSAPLPVEGAVRQP